MQLFARQARSVKLLKELSSAQPSKIKAVEPKPSTITEQNASKQAKPAVIVEKKPVDVINTSPKPVEKTPIIEHVATEEKTIFDIFKFGGA